MFTFRANPRKMIDDLEDETKFVGALFRGDQSRPRTPEIIDLVSDEEEEVVEEVFHDSDETCTSDSESVRSVSILAVADPRLSKHMANERALDYRHRESSPEPELTEGYEPPEEDSQALDSDSDSQ